MYKNKWIRTRIIIIVLKYTMVSIMFSVDVCDNFTGTNSSSKSTKFVDKDLNIILILSLTKSEQDFYFEIKA